MAATLTHRGPDALSYWIDGSVGMAHTAVNHQSKPIAAAHSWCVRRHLAFNGEILIPGRCAENCRSSLALGVLQRSQPESRNANSARLRNKLRLSLIVRTQAHMARAHDDTW